MPDVIAPGRWVTPALHHEMRAHRLTGRFDTLGPDGQWSPVAACGLAARSWQDTATCPPGAAPFPPCEPCQQATEGPAAPAPAEPAAQPWRPAGFAATPDTGARR